MARRPLSRKNSKSFANELQLCWSVPSICVCAFECWLSGAWCISFPTSCAVESFVGSCRQKISGRCAAESRRGRFSKSSAFPVDFASHQGAMTPRKAASTKKKSVEVKTATSSGRGVLQRTSISVASIKEKTRQGLKRLTSKGSLRKRSSNKNSAENSDTNTRRNINQSPAVKVYRPRSDENLTPQRQQPSRKVKMCKGPKQQHKSDLEKRRVPVSMSSALQDMKGNISKAVETVSTKLRINRVGRRSIRQSAYDPLLSADTPVKLYSPFAIGEFEHTPTAGDSLKPSGGRSGRTRTASSSSRTTPRNRGGKTQPLKQGPTKVSRNLLDTPTGKFRQDLEDMTRGFEELSSLTKQLRDRTQQEQIWA